MEIHNSNPKIKDATKVSFSMTNRRLPSHYISSLPPRFYLVSVHEFIKPRVKGESNGFRFYGGSFNYITAKFNLNDFKVDEVEFLVRIERMFSTLYYLNKEPIRSKDVLLILKHIREYSNYVFDVRRLYVMVRSFHYDPSLVEVKRKDFTIAQNTEYKEKIDFLNALNKARGAVNTLYNLKELFYLLEERFENEDYGYLNEAIITGHKKNNLVVYAMVRKFNVLCTGQQRKRRKKVKSEPLYCNSIERLTLKAISLKAQQQNAFIQKGIIVYERELKAFNKLVNNRKIAKQMFLILADLTGLDFDLKIIPNTEVQNQLKAELMNLIDKRASFDLEAGAIEFDRIYKSSLSTYIPLNTNLTDIFDTDMKNSVFNHTTSDDALLRGDKFYYEYLKFHKGDEFAGRMNFGILMLD